MGDTFLQRLRYLFRRRRFDADLAEEMEFHRAMTQREMEGRGESSDDAARASRRAFGSTLLARDQIGDVLVWPWLQDAVRDLRYAARSLRRTPGFAAIAIGTLALGIGANTAIFSLLHAVLLRPLPVRDPQHLVFFGAATATGSTRFLPDGPTQLFSYSFFRDFRRASDAFSDVAAIHSIEFDTHGRVANGTVFERIKVELVSGSYFNTLGLNAVVGRTLADRDDEIPGGHPVAVASYSWWQQHFGGGPSTTEATVSINSRIYTVVGVAPRGFSGVTVGQAPDLWVPLAMEKDISPGWNGLEDPMFQSLHLIARLKPCVSVAQAQTETTLRLRRILMSYLGSQPSERQIDHLAHASVNLTSAVAGRSGLRAKFSSPLKLLMAVVAVVLLIACANVANLLLARSTARRREIGVRISLGAGRLRLVRQLLAEGLLLGLGGAVLGVALASGAGRLLIAMVSTGPDPVPLAIAPDVAVLGFTLAAMLLTVAIFSVGPALQATRLELVASLKEGGRGASSRSHTRMARVLVVAQIALSLVLIAGAALFLRSLANLMKIDTGFDKENVLVASVDPAAAGYQVGPGLNATMDRIEERVAQGPGIRGASFAFFVFNGGSWSTDDIAISGRQRSPSDDSVDLNLVGPQYLDVMRMPIVSGRGLSARDAEASPKVAVINQTMARMYFGDASPLGRTFTVNDDEQHGDPHQWENIEVIGVAKDAKYTTLEEEQMPAAFLPHAQHQRNFLYTLVVRYSGTPAAIVPEIRRAIAAVDPNLPIGETTTLARMVDDSVLSKRAVAQLSAVFGLLAALLACIGIYGVTSYGITRRTNEFGIRMALGAGRSDVLWLVLGEVLRLGLAGVVVGMVLALAAARFVSSLLFGLSPYDPAALGIGLFAMLAVALLAGYAPAARATRVDPVSALRHN
jgi:predicted permease